jgi:hypothetical protein
MVDDALDFRVPGMGEKPEQLIKEIDSSLQYAGKKYGTASNQIYIVTDPEDGLEKVLKIAGAPARIGVARKEHEIFQRLNHGNGIPGIPRVYKCYNSIGSKYNPQKLTAMLREYVDAEDFNACLRNREVYKSLSALAGEINEAGITLPNDFNNTNVRVDKNGQVHIIDFEESWIDPSIDYNRIIDRERNYLKMHQLFVGNVAAHILRSKKSFSKVLKFLDLDDWETWTGIADTFYDGPKKPSIFSGW